MREQIVQELHKPARKHFPRRNVVLKRINDVYRSDLIGMRPHSKVNKGYNYIHTVINYFTKVEDALPNKDRSISTVTDLMRKIILRN